MNSIRNKEIAEKIREDLFGNCFKHFKGNCYIVIGSIFDADINEYKVWYKQVRYKKNKTHDITFTRNFEDFVGMVNGVKRFTEISTEEMVDYLNIKEEI